MTEREARLAALAARRAQAGLNPQGPGDPPVRVTVPARVPRRAPALASRVLVGGLSVAAMLGMVAFIGAGSLASAAPAGADPVLPTTVIHRIIVVASPPPPEPDIVYQVVPAGRNVTVVTIPPPVAAPKPAATVKPKPAPATQTAPAATTTKGSGHKKP